MRLKELRNETSNLLDYIKFFEEIDTEPYFLEMLYIYGNRPLTSSIVELVKGNGLEDVGKIFALRGEQWGEIENITNRINENVLEDSKEVTTKKSNDSMAKKNTTNQTDTNSDYVIAYDETNSSEQGSNEKVNSLNSNEEIDSTKDGTVEKLKTGFNPKKVDYLLNLLETSPAYRFYIYKDIVDILCLKIYDSMI